ncbi:MAG TPA: hypothetical protein VFW80_06250 [Gaiellaceae bacterium]|nr:hypothetical protein [Gaiellaceae bacterium]
MGRPSRTTARRTRAARSPTWSRPTRASTASSPARSTRGTRLRLWAEHLERSQEELAGDPTEVIDSLWRPIAEEQHERRERGEPLQHRLVRLPHVARKSNRLLGPVNGLLVDG